MAKKDLFENMNITDNSYLLDDNLLASEVKTGRSNEETVKLSELEEFPGHPFMVNTENEDFEELVESIKENGLIYPILVRPVAGGKNIRLYLDIGESQQVKWLASVKYRRLSGQWMSLRLLF